MVWTQEGYYAASPGGEKLIGWVTGSDPGKLMTFHPAQRFHKELYRPEVIKLVLKEGSVDAALKAAKVPKQDIEKLLPPQASLKHKQKGDQVTVEVTVPANPNPSRSRSCTCWSMAGRPGWLKASRGQDLRPPPGRMPGNLDHRPGTRPAQAQRARAGEGRVQRLRGSEPGGSQAARRGRQQQAGDAVLRRRWCQPVQARSGIETDGAVPDVQNMEKCLSRHCAAASSGSSAKC